MSTPNPIPTINPATAKFTWTDPTTNADGSPLQAGEITGYDVGIRSVNAAGSAAGAYPIVTNVPDPAATSEAVAAIGTVLKPDTYAAAIRSAGPVPSDWTPEVQFVIAQPVPSSPTGFTVA